MEKSPRMLWRPSGAEDSQMMLYFKWLDSQNILSLDFNAPPESLYRRVWEWSVQLPAAFWKSLWTYFDIVEKAPYSTVLSGEKMPFYRWFEGAALNYAEHVFRQKTNARPAVVFQKEGGPIREMSWAELERQTAAVAAWLRDCGVQKGDRVAAFLPNSEQAVVAALAAMSLGAVWSSCSPDFGASSVIDRFMQIEPRVLIAVDGYQYGGKSFDKKEMVREICKNLNSIDNVLFINWHDKGARLESAGKEVSYWEEVLDLYREEKLEFLPVAFDHPLWILYSSGTTGIPKAITHGHGGNLLEHLKYLRLHADVRPGERFFWFSTTGWMMWNFTLASLLAGATIVLYDGSPAWPDLDALWELAEKTRIHHFGTSAPFLVSCMKAGIRPGEKYDLSALRSIGSTGSPLPPEAFSYVYSHIKPDIWLSSMAGGTDVCTAWVGANPLLPVYEGEIQARCLGCAMESWDEEGLSVPPGEVGEMVVTRPMPSMPVFFWNDADHKKYLGSYFDVYPGVWRHGDWLKITERESVVILGRSDATLNRQGVRIGTAEIYRALDQIAEIRDSLIVNIEKPDGTDWMPLFVVLQEGVPSEFPLEKRVASILRERCSPRHVPDKVIVVPDIPYTISGKKMETPVKKILQKRPLESAFNRDSMRNPEAMDFFIAFAAAEVQR